MHYILDKLEVRGLNGNGLKIQDEGQVFVSNGTVHGMSFRGAEDV